jgi:hypothetical protein
MLRQAIGKGRQTMNPKEAFADLDLETVERWIASQRQEDLHLDFKLLRLSPEFPRDDRKNLAKAVSGFANSDGGLVVWGVDCRKTDGVDCATELVPVKNALAVLGKLQSHTGEATVPIVDGVLHRLIPTVGQDGILVTFVPRSESGPHMAKLGEDRYYKRSGDSFYLMEHFDLADMFGRRPHAVLRLSLALTTGGVFSGHARSTVVQAVVGIENAGRAAARFPFLKIKISPPYTFSQYELDGNGRSGLRKLVRSSRDFTWRYYAGGADEIVHPGTTFDVTIAELTVGEATPSVPDFIVEYELAAEGLALISGSERIAGERIVETANAAMEKSFPRK